MHKVRSFIDTTLAPVRKYQKVGIYGPFRTFTALIFDESARQSRNIGLVPYSDRMAFFEEQVIQINQVSLFAAV